MGNFLRDLAESQVAVDALLNHLIDRGFVAHELEGKREQKCGDIRYYPVDLETPVDIEVKFDKMSKRTGNMCFEIANNKGLTGISKTKADRIVYMCPTSSGYDVYVFEPDTLKSFLFDVANTKKITIKNGGDGKRFTLALVKIHVIDSEKVWLEKWSIDA